jgi:hypothetical protein
MLQPLARNIPSYIKSSVTLKKFLVSMPPLPETAKVFTADAVAMYTNIDTAHALSEIKVYLRSKKDECNGPIRTAITRALTLIMTNNLFQFGDTFWLQTNGTAMGVSPSCCYATLYFAPHEQYLMDKYPELHIFKRYIDDIFGVWIPQTTTDDTRWADFCEDLQKYGKLRWKVSERTSKLNFLDITIELNSEGKFVTSLHEKNENLYLYLPAASAHPPNSLKGLIHGMVHRSLRLTSSAELQTQEIINLYQRLQARGHDRKLLINSISEAYDKVHTNMQHEEQATPTEASLTTTTSDKAKTKPCFFHSQYHPRNPSSKEIQRIYREEIQSKPYRPDLKYLANHEGKSIGVDRLIICYSKPPNLGNLLSPRIVKPEHGPAVSSYMD